MRAVPEMMVIVRGMAASTRSVLCTGFLLSIWMYIGCILFTDAFHSRLHEDGEDAPEAEALFGDMARSAFSLFIFGTILDDVTYCSNSIRETGNLWMLVFFLIFILIASFMMLNMLIGVLVEVVGATSEGEKAKATQVKVREAIGEIFDNMDKDKDRLISREEFEKMKDHEKVMDALLDLDITESHFHLYAEIFFKQEEVEGELQKTPNLTFEELMSMILRLRPGSFVSALDFAAFAKTIRSIQDRVKDRLVAIENTCREMAASEEGLSIHQEGLSARPDANCTYVEMPPPALPASDPVSAFGEAPPSPSAPSQPSPTVRASQLSPSKALRDALPDHDKERLERTPGTHIVEELQRRIGQNGMSNWMGMPPPITGQELQNLQNVPQTGAQAFSMLGVPQDDDDSGTVYV